MPRAPSQPGQQRRLQAITTLLELASEQPPSQISTAQISARMGLSEAALFRHFPSKEALWLATLEHALDQAWQRLNQLSRQSADPMVGLGALLHGQLAIHAAIPGLPRLVFHELQNRSPTACRTAVDNHLHLLRQRLGELLEAAQGQGNLPPQRDPRSLAQILLALVLGLMLQDLIGGHRPRETGDQLDAALALLLSRD